MLEWNINLLFNQPVALTYYFEISFQIQSASVINRNWISALSAPKSFATVNAIKSLPEATTTVVDSNPMLQPLPTADVMAAMRVSNVTSPGQHRPSVDLPLTTPATMTTATTWTVTTPSTASLGGGGAAGNNQLPQM